MPWHEVNEMQERERFLKRAIQPRANIQQLCLEFGISRSLGHKLLSRYREYGEEGTKPYSRRPKSHSLSISAELTCEIVRLRSEHPTWGGRAIRELLLDNHEEAPCSRTIDRVLARAGLVKKRRKSSGKWLDSQTLPKAKEPNDIWTVDFKGWWNTKNRKACFPLTVRDLNSKYLLGIEALSGTNYEATKDVFERLFEVYGLPKQILSDNGAPFASVLSVQGLTRLSSWFVKLGIRPRRILPGCPFMNGSHERMHRDMKEEIQKSPAWNLKEQQKRFDEWRKEYNELRPNQAIGMKRPAKVYYPSKRVYSSEIVDFEYSTDMEVRKTSPRGYISWHQKPCFISGALGSETIGIKPEENSTMSLWFCELKLGITDENFDSPLGGNQRSPYSQRHDRNK